MSKIDTKSYIKHGGCNCPRCGSSELSGDEFQFGDSIAWRSVWCEDCSLSWTDDYSLTGVSEVYCLNAGKDMEHNAQD